jgi:hypothetical protein
MLPPVLRLFTDFDHAANVLSQEKKQIVSNRYKNLEDVRGLLNERFTWNILLKCEEDTETTAKLYNDTMQYTGWNSTPEYKMTLKAYDCPILIKKKLKKKGRLRTEEDRLRTNASKRFLKVTKD